MTATKLSGDKKSNATMRGLPPLILYISGFLDLFGVSMILPLIVAHSRDLGASPTVSGILGSIYGAIQLFTSPIIGSWSDIKGRQYTLMVCLFMAGFGYSLFSISKTVTLMFVARIPLGIFKHSQSITKAYLTEISDKADHATVLGNFNAASNLGFILGPAVGGNIAELPHGFYLVALLTGFIFFLNGCMIWLFRSKTCYKAMKDKNHLENLKTSEMEFSFTNFLAEMKEIDWEDMWDLYLIKFILGVSVILYWSNFSLMLIQKFETSPATNGYVISFKSTVAALVGFITGKIAKLYSNNARLMLHLALLQSLTFLYLAFSSSLWILLIGLVPLAVITTVARVASTSLSMERSKGQDIGLLLGFQQSCMSIARMLAPLIAGIAMEIGPSVPGILAAGLSFLSVLVMLVRPQDPQERQKKFV